MKKALVTLLIVGAGLWMVKKASIFSYGSTLWSQARTEIKKQVPTKFEIERVRHEIANMEQDVKGMIRPIAEYMADISRLKKDLQASKAALAEQKTTLLTMAQDLEGSPSVLVYGGKEYTADKIKDKLQKDFDSYKRCEATAKSQEKLLEAKEKSLSATREQLGKLLSKKREYEVRLAQLEAEEETLRIAKLGTKLEIDDSRATEIEAALAEIERRHEVTRSEIELVTGPFANEFIPVHQKNRPKFEAHDVVEYLQGPTSSTASSQ